MLVRNRVLVYIMDTIPLALPFYMWNVPRAHFGKLVAIDENPPGDLAKSAGNTNLLFGLKSLPSVYKLQVDYPNLRHLSLGLLPRRPGH